MTRTIKLSLMVCFVLLVGFYMQRQGLFVFKATGVYEEAEIVWGNKTNHEIEFTLHSSEKKTLRRLSDRARNEMYVFIVDETAEHYERVKPTYSGNGKFTFSYGLPKAAAAFVYMENDKSTQNIGYKKLTSSPEKRDNTLLPDPILTTKIGSYDVSLIFNTLQPEQPELLMFRFVQKGLRFTSITGRLSRIWAVNEETNEFTTAVSSEKETMEFSLRFPREGTYKIWGEFYINGKKFQKTFVVNVTERRQQ
ncbi:hypothetical protein MUG87_05190 [Ectobacillus sp. JY-23]|uniref:hypothetical protein n=1 Tax=Ectobacillus sp. JY-23 TaxID=2933872 RepID=UPI001FF5A472|nr:hypothetical protein [Ectobacillus sp. JY-23]UOY93520.1 hypothetical protein MUG87_05190 [Ectobacillus sp. JY-23]